MGNFLFHESPVIILPSLAKKIGINEAVILQQVHYWLGKSNHHIDGRTWIYNTYKEWQLQLPFLSDSTIKRTIRSLEKQGYLISANYNRFKMDKTKWYTIDYSLMEELEKESIPTSSDEPSIDQLDLFEEAVQPQLDTDLNKAIPEITTETTKKIDNIPFSEIIDYLNLKTDSKFKPGTKKNQQLITERWNEGFTLEDFKKVIDIKSAEWTDPEWSKYLRPATLFGTKFESYLNQKTVSRKLRKEDFNLDD